MRYYDIVFKTNSEQIKKNSTINLREYAYQNPVGSMNAYLYQNLKNGIFCFGYREDTEVIMAAFAYNERRGTLHEAYDYVQEMLNSVFRIKKVRDEPCEITMYQFYEHLLETRRRDCFSGWAKIGEAANVMIFDYYKNEPMPFRYSLTEKIVSPGHKKESPMYGRCLLQEHGGGKRHGGHPFAEAGGGRPFRRQENGVHQRDRTGFISGQQSSCGNHRK